MNLFNMICRINNRNDCHVLKLNCRGVLKQKKQKSLNEKYNFNVTNKVNLHRSYHVGTRGIWLSRNGYENGNLFYSSFRFTAVTMRCRNRY
jgi:hypothetical protein